MEHQLLLARGQRDAVGAFARDGGEKDAVKLQIGREDLPRGGAEAEGKFHLDGIGEQRDPAPGGAPGPEQPFFRLSIKFQQRVIHPDARGDAAPEKLVPVLKFDSFHVGLLEIFRLSAAS